MPNPTVGQRLSALCGHSAYEGRTKSCVLSNLAEQKKIKIPPKILICFPYVHVVQITCMDFRGTVKQQCDGRGSKRRTEKDGGTIRMSQGAGRDV